MGRAKKAKKKEAKSGGGAKKSARVANEAAEPTPASKPASTRTRAATVKRRTSSSPAVADAPAKAKKPAKGKKPAKAKAPKAAKKTAKRTTASRTGRRKAKATPVDPTLFAPLTEGERADALRVLTEDKRLSEMAKVGRYRVIAIEPLTLKPPAERAEQRLARVVVYDYAADRSVEASIDLDSSDVASLRFTRAQPMLAREEEAAAISIAMGDARVKDTLSLGDEALAAMQYWSQRDTDLAHTRRSAAVMFGRPGNRPSLVAVVDLNDAEVTDVVPASQW